MKRLLILALLAGGCSSNPLTFATGEFTSPTGLGATGAGDRDLLFIANTGRDSLRALQLCNHALSLDGGVDPADTCPQNQHGQFVPAPIRVFPASIETGDRPLRVAGVRLSRADGGTAGVALVAGVTSQLAIVDARSLVDVQTTGVLPRSVAYVDLSPSGADGGTVANPTVDVVAANPLDSAVDIEVSASAVTAFAATNSELLVLGNTLGADGFAQEPTIQGRCTLDPILPTKLAVVPGSDAQVYVADARGGGVVSIQKSSVTPGGGPCVIADRFSTSGRSVQSIALSPPWYDQDANGQPRTRVAGELLIMVVGPSPAPPSPGQLQDTGGVLFAGTGLGLVPPGIVPIPPFDPATETGEPMQPLSLPGPGLLREGTFLRAVRPRTTPQKPDLTACPTAPCTPLSVGQPSTHNFALLAQVSATDGVTYLIDVPNLRFVNQNTYAAADDSAIMPIPGVILPSTGLTLGTLEPGLVRNASWTVTWHAAIPGLERRAGTVTPVDADTLRFTVALANLNLYRDDPAIALAAGDVVSFAGYSLAGDMSQACRTVVDGENQSPFRFELAIEDVQPDHLDLHTLADTPDMRGFHPEGCSAFGAVAEIRTARSQPWLVFEQETVRGRAPANGTFDVHERRFNYPRSKYAKSAPPIAANDLAFSFTITGTPPSVPGSKFTWTLGSGLLPVAYGDQSHSTAGFSTAVYAYSSLRTPTLMFTSVTGMDEVLQADPTLLNSTTAIGTIAYR